MKPGNYKGTIRAVHASEHRILASLQLEDGSTITTTIATAGGPMPKQHNHDNRAGCVSISKAHSTGTRVGIYNNAQAGMCDEGGPWSTVCEDHGRVMAHDSITLAKDFASSPEEWCEQCQEGKV